MKNRVTGILLAGTMALGLLAGCGTTAGQTDSKESAVAEGTGTDGTGTDNVEDNGEVKSINMYTMESATRQTIRPFRMRSMLSAGRRSVWK